MTLLPYYKYNRKYLTTSICQSSTFLLIEATWNPFREPQSTRFLPIPPNLHPWNPALTNNSLHAFSSKKRVGSLSPIYNTYSTSSLLQKTNLSRYLTTQIVLQSLYLQWRKLRNRFHRRWTMWRWCSESSTPTATVRSRWRSSERFSEHSAPTLPNRSWSAWWRRSTPTAMDSSIWRSSPNSTADSTAVRAAIRSFVRRSICTTGIRTDRSRRVSCTRCWRAWGRSVRWRIAGRWLALWMWMVMVVLILRSLRRWWTGLKMMN